jgi:hypothetical protein
MIPYTAQTLPLIFVIGATNAGKSTLLDSVRSYPGIGLVEVGKMMRAKYPPEHFAGQASPTHTAAEAWMMFGSRVIECAADGCRVAFVDGQPRDMTQCESILALPNPKLFLHLWAPIHVREERARKRDSDPTVPDAENQKLQLALKRVIGDIPKLYDVTQRIRVAERGGRAVIFELDTSGPEASFRAASRVFWFLTGDNL